MKHIKDKTARKDERTKARKEQESEKNAFALSSFRPFALYLKLIRIPNLLFLAMMQFLMHWAVVASILQDYDFEVVSGGMSLCLLIMATVFIAAGGYVLNDYFDTKIDAINRPEKVIVGQKIDKNTVMHFYQILTGVGVACGLLLSFLARNYTLAFIFIVIPGLLWFYSSNYKRQFLVGNLVVSFCAALSVLVVAISEVVFLQNQFGELIFYTPIPQMIYTWIGGFALFAFVLTWIREIIKDMEDEKGDREMECRTMPIKWGMKRTKIFLYALISLTIIVLFTVGNLYIPFEGMLSVRYIIFGLILPLVALIYLIFKADIPADFRQASTLSKIVMIIGVLYSLVFSWLIG